MDAQKKKKLFMGLGAIAGILLLAAAGWVIIFLSKFSSYTDAGHKFTVKYPRAWQVVKPPAGGPAVIFLSAKENAMDIIQENINITVQPVPDEIASLKTFSETITKQMQVVFKSNIKILEDKPIEFGGRHGGQMVFEAPKPNSLKVLVAWTMKSGQAYILTFITTMSKYPEYKSVLNEVVKSFQFK